MKTPLTVAALVALLAVASQAQAAPASFLLGPTGWEAFATTPSTASLAWAGEDETFADSFGLVGKRKAFVSYDESVVDTKLITGIAAPEPPALVLAGMAFGGVLCGRSLLRRKAAKPKEESLS